LIQPIINSYNDIIQYIKQDTTTKQTDSSVSGLLNNLRDLSSQSTTPSTSDGPKYLTELGITVASNGTLSFTDDTKLTNLLKTDPQKVAQLFTGVDSSSPNAVTAGDGFASKLKKTISNLIGSNGIIQNRTKSLGTQIDQTQKKTQALQDRIDKQGESLRKQYTTMLQLYLQAQNQTTYLTGLQSTTTTTG
jgi:flagellar hook-associated protein 2